MSLEEEKQRLRPAIQGDKTLDASDDLLNTQAMDVQRQSQMERKKKTIKWVLIGVGITVVVILAIVLPIVLTKGSGDNPDVPPGPNPDNPGLSNETIYNPYVSTAMNNQESTIEGYIYAKNPYKPEQHMKAYQSLTSFSANLSSPHNFTTLPKQFPIGMNNMFKRNLSYSFYMTDYHVAALEITDAEAEKPRYSIPEEAVNKPKKNPTMRLEMLGLQVFQEPFSFQFNDIRDSNNWYLHTNHSTLRLYGFGERTKNFSLSEGTWTMWASGKNNVLDDGLGGKNAYGVHPFVLAQTSTPGDFIGIFFRNSNAQSPLVRFNETTGHSTISYITTGGQLEIFFFLHGSPKYIIQQYQYVIGTPNLPPVWSMGWHQASYAYKNQSMVENMMAQYEDKKLPLDAVWLDITYMDNYEDFTVDKKAFPDLQGLAGKLHANYQKIVPIIDGGLSAVNMHDKYYQLATQKETLIETTINKGNKYSDALVSKVWPDKVVFMDWFSRNAYQVWRTGLSDLQKLLPFDGLWLDMNEATTFWDGEYSKEDLKDEETQETDFKKERFLRERPIQFEDEPVEPQKNDSDPRTNWFGSYLDQSKESTYYLPFIPGEWYSGNLDKMSLSLNGTHPSNNLTEYDLHSLYGHKMSEASYHYLAYDVDSANFGQRPFILTRSTFAGTGRYASHWTGDNYREWDFMRYSIASIMNFNMFGIPQVGSDICGFFGKGALDQELCTRWIQLATFYPFARNHYEKDSTASEPYQLTENYLATAREAMFNRYSYVRLMYTCLYEASMWGTTCFDPMFFHYPDDPKLYDDMESTFMVANNVKVSPILKPGVREGETYSVYFPKGKWASLTSPGQFKDGGANADLTATKLVQAHLKPGGIIPFQENKQHDINKIHQLRERPISLIINRDSKKLATGSVLLDTGSSMAEMTLGQYEYYTFTYQEKTIQKKLSGGTHGSQKLTIDKIVIYQAEDLGNTDYACYYTPSLDVVPLKVTYTDDFTLTLTFQTPIPYNQWRQVNLGSNSDALNLCSPTTYQYATSEGVLPDLSTSSATFEARSLGKANDLTFTLKIINGQTVNVKWTFKSDTYTPYEVPEDYIKIEQKDTYAKLSQFVKVLDNPLRIQILNNKKQPTVTISEFLVDKHLNYYRQQLQASKGDDFRGIMGLGERVTAGLFYEDGVYSLWNRDSPTPPDNGRPPGKNVYGTHPFFMYKNQAQSWIGVFTKVAAAQDWYIKNDKPTGKVDVTMFASGGLGDVYYIIENNPNNVIAAYMELVGKPVLIPQWALGWHQCKWGYETAAEVADVVANYSNANLPLDVQWSDIDYLYNYRDFTYDHMRYKELPDLIADLHSKNMKYVPILDAGIAARQSGVYPAFDRGKEADIFIKVGTQPLIGQVWPNDAAYPDFFNPKAVSWWQDELTHMWGALPFDGLWEDMNEASDFCSGYCYQDQKVEQPMQFQMRYTPTGRYLEQQSMPLDGTHFNGAKQIDTHNLFGISEVKATHDWFKMHKTRTFIITRSSFAGIGKFGSKWLGDNYALPYYMGQSVTGIMQMNMFGVPLAGSDICGFIGDTSPELCARWYVVGAFQPFSRNHNNYGNSPQEPYRFSKWTYEGKMTYTDIIRIAMRAKYCLIRYYYTLMFQISKQGGGPVYKPMFFEFPEDMGSYDDPQNNVMIGSALKVSVLANNIGQNITEFYYPPGTWCNIFDHTEKCFTSMGEKKNQSSKAYDFYAYLKDGHILPVQDAFAADANTTVDLQSKPVSFYINPQNTSAWASSSWQASGLYVNDDGEAFNINGNHNTYQLLASQGGSSGKRTIIMQITSEVATNYKPTDAEYPKCYGINKNDWLGEVMIFNAKNYNFNTRYIGIVFYNNGTEDSTKFWPGKYDSSTDSLNFDFKGQYCLTELSHIEMISEV